MSKLLRELLVNLESTINHLKKYKEKNWTVFFKNIHDEIDKGNIHIVDSLKKLRNGGMGSFNDFGICIQNGHEIKEEEIHFANEELQRLVDNIISIANSLSMEIDKS